jgi:hypothetical protein
LDPLFERPVFLPLALRQRFKEPNTLDFSKVPEREMSASQLGKTFYDMRGQFSKCYRMWSRSGQNDPDNFPDFCAIGPDGYLTAVGERCCILAAALNVGKPNENTDLLTFTVRICEAGIETDLDGKGIVPRIENVSGHSSLGRKRKLSSLGANSSEPSLADQVSDCLRPVFSMLRSTIESQPGLSESELPQASAIPVPDSCVNERRRLAMITLREAYATLDKVPEAARSVVQSQIDSILDEMSRLGK